MSVRRRLRLSSIETSRLARLAAPILGAQLAQMGMGTLDVAMTGHVDATALAAVSIGSSVWLPVVVLIIGTLMGLTPIVAQAVGERQWTQIRPALHQALWIALVLGLAAAAVVALPGIWLVARMDASADVVALAGGYLHAVAFGLPAIAGYETLRFYSDGLGHTRASLLFALLGLAVNALANAVLIFGVPALGLPALGAMGCGMATAISMWSMLIGLFVYTRLAPAYVITRVGAAWSAPAWRAISAQLRLGLPIGVSIFSEVSLFTAITLLLASYGDIVVSAHTVALNFSSLMFMVPLSLGFALTVRVGQARGRGKFRHARFVALNGLVVALAMALVIDAILIFGGPLGVALYTDDAAVRTLAIHLLLVATIFQFSDAAQVTLSGALRGYKDTRVVMWFTLLAYWPIGLGLGHVLATGIAPWFDGFGVYGYWIGLIAGLSAAALMLGARFQHVSRGRLARAL